MKEILTAFTIAMQTLKSKADAALKGMGPIDQHEGATEVGYALRTLKYAQDEVGRMLEQVEKIDEKFSAELKKAADEGAAAKIEEQIAAGELVRKTDHTLALEQAKKDGKEEAELSFKTEKEELQIVTARRLDLTTKHGAALASTVKDDSLKGDDAAFNALETEAGRRIAELATFGITAEAKEKPFKEIVAFSYDEDGIKAFDARIDGLKDLGLKPDPKGKDGAHLSRQPGATHRVPPVTNPQDSGAGPATPPEKKGKTANACF